MVRQGEKTTYKCCRVKGGISSPVRFKDQCQNQTVLVATDNSSNLHKQTRRNPVSGDVCSPVKNHDLVPSLPDNPKMHVMADLLSQLNQLQSTEWSLHLQVFKTDLSKVVHSSCRFICHLSEPQSSIVRISSPRPTCLEHRCSEHKLVGSHCLCLPSHDSKN